MSATAVSNRARPERYLEQLSGSFARKHGGKLSAVIEWELRREVDRVDRFQLELAGGRCTWQPGGDRHPSVRLSLAVIDFLRMLEGEVSPSELFICQRLTVSGDVLFAARLPQLFPVGAWRPSRS